MDDIPAITWNTTIRTLWPPSTVFSPPPRTAATGRPIVNLSLALNYASGGLNVTSYHLFNLAFHVLAAVVLFGIVRRALVAPALGERFRERATGIAASVSLLWVVHPLTSECIDYTIPNSASAHHNLARALVRQGLTIEAIEHFETALRLQPDFPSARRALEDLRRSLNQ